MILAALTMAERQLKEMYKILSPVQYLIDARARHRLTSRGGWLLEVTPDNHIKNLER